MPRRALNAKSGLDPMDRGIFQLAFNGDDIETAWPSRVAPVALQEAFGGAGESLALYVGHTGCRSAMAIARPGSWEIPW